MRWLGANGCLAKATNVNVQVPQAITALRKEKAAYANVHVPHAVTALALASKWKARLLSRMASQGESSPCQCTSSTRRNSAGFRNQMESQAPFMYERERELGGQLCLFPQREKYRSNLCNVRVLLNTLSLRKMNDMCT